MHAQIAQDKALMIDLLRVNQRLRAGVALKAAWEGFDDNRAASPRPSADAVPPEAWSMAVVAAQLSWHQVLCVRISTSNAPVAQ